MASIFQFQRPDQLANFATLEISDLTMKHSVVSNYTKKGDDFGVSLSGDDLDGNVTFGFSISYKNKYGKTDLKVEDVTNFKYNAASLEVTINPPMLDRPNVLSRASDIIRGQLKGQTYEKAPILFDKFVQSFGTDLIVFAHFFTVAPSEELGAPCLAVPPCHGAQKRIQNAHRVLRQSCS